MRYIALIFFPLFTLVAINSSKIGFDEPDFKSANEEIEKKHCSYVDMDYDYEYSVDKIFETPVKSKAAIHKQGETWKDGIVPYVISQKFNAIERNTIEAAMFQFEQNTCIKFRARKEEDDYLVIEKSSNYVGRQEDEQKVWLSTRKCFSKSLILHYLMRAIGFYNEHNRRDRDKYVTILWDNIERGKERYFCKYGSEDVQNFTEPYDFNSIMHYTEVTYSKDRGSPTVVAKTGVKIGPKNESFSESDIIKIKKLYYCPAVQPLRLFPLQPAPGLSAMGTMLDKNVNQN